MKTENEMFDITVAKVNSGVICLDFRTLPNMKKLTKIGYADIHFQLSPKDAEKLGALLMFMGGKK